MQSKIVKTAVKELSQYIPIMMPVTCWYYSRNEIESSARFKKDEWDCFFRSLEIVNAGGRICFSPENTGCSGAACYLGFKEPSESAGKFLANDEKYKKNEELGNEHYRNIKAPKPLEKYLVFERIDNIEDNIKIEILNLWVDALCISGLTTLANFDRAANSNVIIPFASGCQSLWTIPYKENLVEMPKAVIGLCDPAVRKYIPNDVLSFSV